MIIYNRSLHHSYLMLSIVIFYQFIGKYHKTMNNVSGRMLCGEKMSVDVHS